MFRFLGAACNLLVLMTLIDKQADIAGFGFGYGVRGVRVNARSMLA
jgi:hypothetical protein